MEADSSELERIEALLDRFNVFEAFGFIGQELMHSRFLAFLLDPKQNHGLGDVFLRKMLEKAAATSNATSLPKAFEDIGNRNMEETVVQTEVHTDDGRIDILLLDEVGKRVTIIENKIWTFEHSDQLGRYYRFVKKQYPGWQVHGIYLTRQGDAPSDIEDRKRYLPLSYGTVCEILEQLLENRGSTLAPDLRMGIEHYVGMVRRHIVGDSEIANLCQQIYRKHQRALDLIYEHRPDPRGSVRDLLVRLIRNTKGLIYKGGHRDKYIYFYPTKWDVPALNIGDDPEGFLRFVFHNHSGELVLFLGTSLGKEGARRRLFDMGRRDESLFNHLVEDPGRGRNPKLYRRTFLTQESFEDLSDHGREQEIRRQWGEFREKDLPRIKEALEKETWIWESVETDEEHSDSPSRFVRGEGDVETHEPPQHEE